MNEHRPTAGPRFERLVEILAKLRAPGGCPWDREQTFGTIKPYLLEETYEALDSIDARDWNGLADELGDLMLQVVFFSQMASEEGLFTIEDALDAVNAKLIRRHPHVFADATAQTPDDVKRNWDRIKAGERKDAGTAQGLLDSVPRNAPALVEASALSAKAAGAGFDWENRAQVTAKLHEELDELDRACLDGAAGEIESEIGDLLFVLVNMARFAKVDPEQALRKTNAKFRRRFGHIEAAGAARGKALDDMAIDEMETLWREAKTLEKAGAPAE